MNALPGLIVAPFAAAICWRLGAERRGFARLYWWAGSLAFAGAGVWLLALALR